jgi:hypothetical protein
MRNIINPKLIYLKAILFLAMGLFASACLLFEAPDIRVMLLLFLSIWAFCRAYYFAFYVIEHYVDREYRFSGLGSFIKYLLSNSRRA